MDSIASKLVSTNNCGEDLKLQNPLVIQALQGLQNYKLYYGAGCLKDSATDVYCIAHMKNIKIGYVLAITNSTNPADVDTYYLPTIPFVSGARPSCTFCTQQLFEIYYTFSSNSTLVISKNYEQAAETVDLSCGTDFVNATTRKTSDSVRVVVGNWSVLVWGWTALMVWAFT
jgi:hypothetical protein